MKWKYDKGRQRLNVMNPDLNLSSLRSVVQLVPALRNVEAIIYTTSTVDLILRGHHLRLWIDGDLDTDESAMLALAAEPNALWSEQGQVVCVRHLCPPCGTHEKDRNDDADTSSHKSNTCIYKGNIHNVPYVHTQHSHLMFSILPIFLAILRVFLQKCLDSSKMVLNSDSEPAIFACEGHPLAARFSHAAS